VYPHPDTDKRGVGEGHYPPKKEKKPLTVQKKRAGCLPCLISLRGVLHHVNASKVYFLSKVARHVAKPSLVRCLDTDILDLSGAGVTVSPSGFFDSFQYSQYQFPSYFLAFLQLPGCCLSPVISISSKSFGNFDLRRRSDFF